MISNTTILLNSTSINPGSALLTASMSMEQVIKLSITGECQYNMSKTWESCGLRVKIHSSPDGSNWDITPYAEFDAPTNLSKYARATVSIIPDPSFIRCQIINQNTNETAYDCKLIVAYSKSG